MANRRPYAPLGWFPGDDFSEHGQIVQVLAGDGVTGPRRVLVSREIPPHNKAEITRILIRIVDAAAYDQLIFGLRRNGGMISPFDRITGERVVEDRFIEINRVLDSGLFEIVAINISGQDVTAWPGAMADPLTIRVVAAFDGKLLSPG